MVPLAHAMAESAVNTASWVDNGIHVLDRVLDRYRGLGAHVDAGHASRALSLLAYGILHLSLYLSHSRAGTLPRPRRWHEASLPPHPRSNVHSRWMQQASPR